MATQTCKANIYHNISMNFSCGEVMVYKWPGGTWFIEWNHQVSVGGKDLATFSLIYVVKSQLGDPCNCKLLVKDG